MNDLKLINTMNFTPLSLEEPDSWVGHMPFGYWLINQLRPAVVVELGTHSGNSYFTFCQSVKEFSLSTKCYAVDTWQGDLHAGIYDSTLYEKVHAHNNAHYQNFSRLMRMTFDTALEYFADSSIDLLHIDGLHTYDAVRHDFETWLPKLAPGAIVLFHDITVRERNFGVWKLWGELTEKYVNTFEFMHSNGLGVLRLEGGGNSSFLDDVFKSEDIKMDISKYFSALGTVPQLRLSSECLRRNIDGLKAQLKQQADQSALELNLMQDALHKQEQSFTSSLSWRVTRPLRYVAKILRGNRHFFFKLIEHMEMVPRYLYKVKAIYIKDGLVAVLRAIVRRLSTQINQPHDAKNYSKWLRRYDWTGVKLKGKLKINIEDLKYKPTISIIMPVFNSDVNFLAEAIESVKTQLYPHWQLCIANDASTNPEIKKLLDQFELADSRINIVHRAQNGHISAASNSALAIANGDWVAFLDHDDLLTEQALYSIVSAINKNQALKLVYSDEDKIDANGVRYDPYFKCDFNYDLFLAQNIICHLAAYRRDLVDQVGGLRVGFEGAQDYDLALRCIEAIEQTEIHHIPEVLYHWRAIVGSTALSAGEKSYASTAGRKAVQEHLDRKEINAVVEQAPEALDLNRVRYAMPLVAPMVSIVIPTRDKADILQQCIDSILLRTAYPNYEIIIVDNGSVEQGTFNYFQSLRRLSVKLKIIRDDSSFNYSRVNNMAVMQASGEFVCLMNNDIEILNPDWLNEMVSHAHRVGIGCVGARLWYPDDRLQHGGVILGIGGVAGHSHKYLEKGNPGYFARAVLTQELSAVTAACLVIKKSIYEEVGGLDEKLAIAFNDIDFCLRVRSRNYKNIWTPYAEMIHHESMSRGVEDTPEKIKRFNDEVSLMKKRWGRVLTSDPFYSPNLSDHIEDFSYAWPPRELGIF